MPLQADRSAALTLRARRGEKLRVGHTAQTAHFDRYVFQTEFFADFDQRATLAAILDHDRFVPASGEVFLDCPPHISRFIVSILIRKAVDAVFRRRARADVREKRREILSPEGGYLRPASGDTSGFHRHPRDVLGRSGKTVFHGTSRRARMLTRSAVPKVNELPAVRTVVRDPAPFRILPTCARAGFENFNIRRQTDAEKGKYPSVPLVALVTPDRVRHM
jgi:hypothetical protein